MTPAGRRSLVLGPLLVALLTAGSSVPTAGTERDGHSRATASAEGSPGVGDVYYPLDGNGGIDVQHYDIRTRYDLGSARLSGTTTLTVTATEDLARFNLDFLLPVSGVRVDGVRADHRRARGHELVITPRRTIAAGSTVRVTVRYAGSPARRSYEGQRNWLANRHEVVTMNEPHMAAWWFPANDHPSDKAGFRISVTVPSGQQAIANGELVSRRRHGGLTTWTWASPEPMASYLAYFAAGRFKLARGESDGRPWTVAVSTMLLPRDRRTSMRLLRTTPELVSWLESELGAYPFGSTGGLVTSLNPGFALENQTRPVYPTLYPGATWLLVHELAHQWFGNSVSVARWRDIWLNEGAATFMEKRYHEVHHGRPAQDWLVEQHGLRRDADPFWRVRIGDPGKGRLFDAAVYDRGAMTLQALRHRVGEDAFWAILRGWLADRAGGNATSEEFETYAEQVSGQDLDGFFQAWLRTPARPARTAENGLL